MRIDTVYPTNEARAYGFTWPDALRLRGSIIRISFPMVLAMTLYGIAVEYLLQKYPEMAINLSVLSLVSLVLSLLLVFRTNSAYDRFWEGRKLWQDLKAHSRNLIRTIWTGVAENSVEDQARKQEALKYIAAFIVSVKHYLRGHDGVGHADYDELLSPTFKLQYSAQDSPGSYGAIAGAGISSPEMSGLRLAGSRVEDNSFGCNGQLPLPIHILYELQKFIENAQDNRQVHAQLYSNILSGLNSLSTLLGGCERILSTPIPLAYRIHLHHALYLYLLVLPWSLGSMSLGKASIIQFVIAFMMIGIDSISREIQNPFGYDSNDLPLGDYCNTVVIELQHALSRRGPKSYVGADDTLTRGTASGSKVATNSFETNGNI